jgi:multiple sugar transport system permease protein
LEFRFENADYGSAVRLLQFLLGFALALLLNRSFRGRGVLRAVSMIPGWFPACWSA